MEGSEENEDLLHSHYVADIMFVPLSKFLSLQPARG